VNYVGVLRAIEEWGEQNFPLDWYIEIIPGSYVTMIVFRFNLKDENDMCCHYARGIPKCDAEFDWLGDRVKEELDEAVNSSPYLLVKRNKALSKLDHET